MTLPRQNGKVKNGGERGAPVSTEVTVLFSRTRGMETVLYSQMFVRLFQFLAQVKFAAWVET